MPLPTSLSATLLAKILRYVPGQRRKLEIALQQVFPTYWAQRSPSDHDFYEHLHNFLQNPVQRARFNEIARKHSTKRRSLALTNAIYAHYIRQQPDIPGKLSDHSTPTDILRTLAQDDDMDRLANIAWAFYDDGALEANSLQDFIGEFPTLRDRLGHILLGGSDTPTQRSWQSTISSLKIIFDKLDPDLSDTTLASQFLSEATRLHEIADADRLRFWHELRELFATHHVYIETSEELMRISRKLNEVDQKEPLPSSCHSILETLQEAFKHYLEQDALVRDASERMIAAPLVERQPLIEQVTLSHQKQQESIHAIQSAIDAFLLADSNAASSSSNTIPARLKSRLRLMKLTVLRLLRSWTNPSTSRIIRTLRPHMPLK